MSPKTGEEAIWYGGIGFAVANGSKHQEAASNLAAFLAFNEDAQRTNIEKGQAIPNLIDMAKDEWLTTDKPPANKAEFIRISGASWRESHAHGVTITRESPNYPGGA